MDPFYLGIPPGPAIPPVEHTGLQRINRRDPQQQPPTPQQQERDEPDEFEDEESDEDLEPIETYDDHGRLHDRGRPHELGLGAHQLEAGDGDPPELAAGSGRALPPGSEEPAPEPEPEHDAADGDRRRRGGPGHIDISA